MYRRANGSALWHSNPQCESWPLVNFRECRAPSIGGTCAKCDQMHIGEIQERLRKPPSSDDAR